MTAAVDNAGGDDLRVVHVLEPSAGDGAVGALLSAAAATATAGVTHEVVVRGSRDDVEAALAAGVVDSGGRPGHAPPRSSGARVAHLVRARRPDVVHAWSARTGTMLIGRLAAPLVVTRTVAGPVRQPIARPPAVIVAIGSSAAVGLDGPGATVPAVIVPPASPPLPVDDRRGLRERWGVPERAFAIGLVGEPADDVDLAAARHVALSLAVSGRDVRLVAARPRSRLGGRAFDWAAGWLAAAGQPGLLIDEPALRRPWRAAAALDAIMLLDPPRGAGVTPSLLHALLAAGAAVVASQGALTDDADPGPAAITRVEGPDVAAALLRLHDSPRRRAAQRDAARRAAADTTASERFVVALERIYAGCAVAGSPRCSGSSSAAAASW